MVVNVTDLADERLPAQHRGAKALLLTILGEFVLPTGGEVWTSTLVAGLGALDIGEKNARQAIARSGEEGLIEAGRHGRRVRWSLTDDGRALLESGAERIYSFGRSSVDWEGVWLVVHCPVSESQRPLRNRLRTRLGFLGFGELSASLLISPHVEREPELRRVLAEVAPDAESTVLRSETGSDDEDAVLVRRAWDLDALADGYRRFDAEVAKHEPAESVDAFRHTVELVHQWRRFPFVDPELPGHLLPQPWAGSVAAETFRSRRAAWAPEALAWFEAAEGVD